MTRRDRWTDVIVERSQEEVDEQLNLAMEAVDRGRSKWPGMSYEDGVRAALNWMTGDDETPPMEDE